VHGKIQDSFYFSVKLGCPSTVIACYDVPVSTHTSHSLKIYNWLAFRYSCV